MLKKMIVVIVLLCTVWTFASAQEVKDRPKYRNLAFVTQSLKFKDGGFKLKSDYAGAFSTGRTYYLHKKPILGFLRFGIDWTYFDLNFAYYNEKGFFDADEEEDGDFSLYQLEAAMHFGPSITLSPLRNLKINVYGRFAPSFTGIYNDYTDDFSCAYASFMVGGAAISYKVISFGVEQRWGEAKYKFSFDDEEEGYSEKLKLETASTRFYISFRF